MNNVFNRVVVELFCLVRRGVYKFMGRCLVVVRYKKLWEGYDGDKRFEEFK